MNIALVTSLLSGGGAARVLALMAGHWSAAGYQVTLFSFEPEGSQPFYALREGVGVRYLNVNQPSQGLFSALAHNWRRCRALRREIRAVRPDAVISFVDATNVQVLLALMGSGIPVVVSERIHPAHEDIGRIWSALRRLAYPLARCVAVQTRDAAAFFSGWGLRDLRVIPNPVQPLPVRGTAPQPSRPFLLAAGRLCVQKAFGLLLDAFAAVAGKHPEWSLCIAGEGPARGELEGQILALGLEGRVLLPGQVEDMGGLMEQAGCFVLSSAYEGFPNVLCEAMSAGLACVSTDCPSGPADLIVSGENGLLVPNSDVPALARGLDELLSDATLRQRLGRAARAVQERYGLEQVMAAWEQALNGREARERARTAPHT